MSGLAMKTGVDDMEGQRPRLTHFSATGGAESLSDTTPGGINHRAPRHGKKLSTGTPTSSLASAPHSDDTAATPPNQAHQNTVPILVLYEFKRVLKGIAYQ